MSSVGPIMCSLKNDKLAASIKDGKLLRWYDCSFNLPGNTPKTQQPAKLKKLSIPKGEHIYCRMKDGDITAANCLPDDSQRSCRQCPHVDAA